MKTHSRFTRIASFGATLAVLSAVAVISALVGCPTGGIAGLGGGTTGDDNMFNGSAEVRNSAPHILRLTLNAEDSRLAFHGFSGLTIKTSIGGELPVNVQAGSQGNGIVGVAFEEASPNTALIMLEGWVAAADGGLVLTYDKAKGEIYKDGEILESFTIPVENDVEHDTVGMTANENDPLPSVTEAAVYDDTPKTVIVTFNMPVVVTGVSGFEVAVNEVANEITGYSLSSNGLSLQLKNAVNPDEDTTLSYKKSANDKVVSLALKELGDFDNKIIAHYITEKGGSGGVSSEERGDLVRITAAPDKSSYKYADEYKITVNAYYSGSPTKAYPVKAWTSDPVDITKSAIGTVPVTVSYEEGDITQTANFNITLNRGYMLGNTSSPDLMLKLGVLPTAYDWNTQTATDVTDTFKALHAYINDPDVFNTSTKTNTTNNVVHLGDYIDLPYLKVMPAPRQDNSQLEEDHGAIDTANVALGGHGALLRLIVVGINSYNRRTTQPAGHEDTPHVVFQFQNLPGKYHMNATNTNDGGYALTEMRSYVKGLFLDGLKQAGVPSSVIWSPVRTGHNSPISMTDALYIPTLAELLDANDRSGSGNTYSLLPMDSGIYGDILTNNSLITHALYDNVAEQAKLEYYHPSGAAARRKYDINNVLKAYWTATPTSVVEYTAPVVDGNYDYSKMTAVRTVYQFKLVSRGESGLPEPVYPPASEAHIKRPIYVDCADEVHNFAPVFCVK